MSPARPAEAAAADTPVPAPAPPRPEPPPPPGVLDRLYAEPFAFDAFQAVRLLEQADAARRPVGREGPPAREAVRLAAHASLEFPPSAVFDLERPAGERPVPKLSVNYFGLTGPSGVLPRHYTEMVLRLAREAKGPERTAMRDWFGVFDHRLLSLFHRAWEKYRFWRAYERGEAAKPEPDAFTAALFSLIGLGDPALRGRLRAEAGGVAVARTDDFTLLRYSGLLAGTVRNAASLERLLADHFGLAVRVEQFVARWLPLEAGDLTRLGGANARLGRDAVAGDRVRDVRGKFRVVLGPLTYARLKALLPDPAAGPRTFFLLCQLVRLYAGPDLDFDVQLLLAAAEVPALELGAGPRLGWDTWLVSRPPERDAGDAVFEGADATRVG